MRCLASLAAFLLAAGVGTATAAEPPDALAAVLRAHPEWFGEVLARAGEHRLQVLYTQIDRDAANRPVFRSYSFGLTDEYFYPASTVKLPAAVLALEKLRDLAVPGLTRDTPLRIEAATAAQAAVDRDPSKADGLPTIAHYVKKVFLVSDNDAFNRLYEFLGQREINERLWSRGFTDARILRRLEAALDPEENRLTNPFVFFEEERVLHRQPLGRNPEAWTNEARPGVRQGKGFLRDGKLVEQPFDFSYSSYLSVPDLQGILRRVLFPEAVPEGERFRLTEDDYRFLYTYMSMLPRESTEPAYPDRDEHPDSYVKFFLFGDSKERIPSRFRIFNKVGDAYGYLIDNAYVVDFEAGVEFLLTAVIHVNADQVFNDDAYEYDEVGMPFLARLGRAVYEHELRRERPRRPDLSRFRVHAPDPPSPSPPPAPPLKLPPLLRPPLQLPPLPQMPTAPPPVEPSGPQEGQAGKDVIWLPTPEALVERMLTMAQVGPRDVLYDLGSGDGRLVIAAARRAARSVGVEFNPELVAVSERRARENGVAGKARFVEGDIFETDFSEASVVTLYLLPALNLRLRPTLLRMKPGTRVVSHAFGMEDWAPDESSRAAGRTAHLWIVPAPVGGPWRVALPGGPSFDVTLAQRYQEIEGTVALGAVDAGLREPSLRGDAIRFGFVDGNGAWHELAGTVSGDRMSGTYRVGGRTGAWTATRR
jgi:hypothetical protein